MNGFDWNAARDALPLVLEGFRVTLLATVLGTLVAAVLGLAIAVAGRAPSRLVTVPVRVVMEFIRSTPLLVQLVGAAALFTAVEPLTIGIAVLGVHYAAYTSEVYRAGIDGVPKGQWEACRALSLTPRRTWQAVILPQAVRNVLPALGNYAISMFKETPFLAVITVQEMVFEARKYGADHFAYTEAFTLAGLVFLVASYPTSLLMRKLEKRLGH
ncbi:MULTISPECIES: ectoine/hydroxyectoine ABC transporter permease subunit EhuD [Streptomyces]|uniref:ectoine/hydroxyectoine ABC transporter permease subunit EhuD n=1 Tax=unclassified Streptomyces TaxID=2593676 RepID=UPI0004CB7FE8|nr:MULTISPECIES: ectoine/hydroxyectoine ABC transporter permease subunit EhuD [unclassified Streptomyces]MDX2728334.1 ectoine/hydroxyectoine ABC transporter permease subunit EhuD [Streptomyces sp. PA03-2a]MDX3769330.1 ectoine/hydroxyectoine ABC transporter permease subunit EhuD [Streptomyces sp. AK08-01B]MDX3818394.1 ectoine/hydroxyectoine ABC transporter permease subunit EhuD [Streptomyces sp. AK08-01A]WSQ29415.1 ectoine/hydroxyectoine ABC transporter permease subunit EhuD [Streptomyces sp. NB